MSAPRANHTCRVVLGLDDETERTALGRALRRAGYIVLELADEQALDRFMRREGVDADLVVVSVRNTGWRST